MKSICEWIIGDNIGGERWFLVHAADPFFIAEIADADEEREEAILDSFSYSGGEYDLFNFVWLSPVPGETKLRRLLASAVAAIGAHNTRTEEMLDLEEAESIGERIRLLREQAAMTQADLAVAIGSKQSHVCAIETDRRDPSLDVLRRIAKALGVSPDKLLD